MKFINFKPIWTYVFIKGYNFYDAYLFLHIALIKKEQNHRVPDNYINNDKVIQFIKTASNSTESKQKTLKSREGKKLIFQHNS